MNTVEIFKRLKIGLSLVIGFCLAKLAAAWDREYYSTLFTIGFLAGSISTRARFGCMSFGGKNAGPIIEFFPLLMPLPVHWLQTQTVFLRFAISLTHCFDRCPERLAIPRLHRIAIKGAVDRFDCLRQ